MQTLDSLLSLHRAVSAAHDAAPSDHPTFASRCKEFSRVITDEIGREYLRVADSKGEKETP